MTEKADNQPFDEKRVFERLDKSFTLHFKVLASDSLPYGELDRQGHVCDIGAGGLRFKTDGSVNKNEQLLILLEFTGWRVDGEEWIPTDNPEDRGTLKVLGKVMWCGEENSANNEMEVGVCFIGRIF